MIYNVIVRYDRRLGKYTAPSLNALSIDKITESIKDGVLLGAIQDPAFSEYYVLGTYDDVKAQFITEESPQFICACADFLPKKE